MLPSCGLDPGPDEVGPKWLKSALLMTSLTKNLKPQTKKCLFIANYKTCCLL